MAASCISSQGERVDLVVDAAVSAFARLDELAVQPTRGFTLVHAAAELAPTLARHLERRALGIGRRVECVDTEGAAEPWHELARRLRVGGAEPAVVAERILAVARDALLLVCVPVSTRWGARVADALAAAAEQRDGGAWIVELTRDRRSPFADPVVVTEPLAADDIERFWRALLHDGRRSGRGGLERLATLERSWWDARAAAPVESTLSVAAREALGVLSLWGGSLDREGQERLGVAAAREELLRSGLVAGDGVGRVWLRASITSTPTTATTRDVARALGASDDPWDALRSAELSFAIGDVADAVASAERALVLAEATAREDLWHRLESALAHAEADPSGLLRLAELALELGDGDPALRLARLAARHGDGFEVSLVLGRASAARGDLPHAERALERAVACAGDEAERLRALVELAEVLCSSGAAARAFELAEAAAERALAVATRLAARNVLGKLLMAAGDWDGAACSFAEDAHAAALSGELEIELRAQLNQASALVGGGRRAEAQAILTAVLAAAERAGSLRAKAFALSNLAVLATQRHDYAEALGLREQALSTFQRIGNREWLARSMVYLADLRIDLGFAAEAEQALAFARQVLGPSGPPTQAAWMSLVATRIHLERGGLTRAWEELDAAIDAAARSTDGTILADCHALAVRVALAEADVARAELELGRAREHRGGAHKEAELALLEAHLRLAEGSSFVAAAEEALRLARAHKDRVRMAEAHLLLHRGAAEAGDEERARSELVAARRLHETIGRTLPPSLRGRYAARVDKRVAAPPDVVAREASDRPVSSRGRGQAGGMVGSHPAMQAMFEVLAKVAATDATVLVFGESGTGKELVADDIHRRSPRRRGPMVKVNCAALVETLLLSELFGHERGAFTGASRERRGCFELADGGTIFLDEIGDVSPATQAALLRVLQDRTFHRVGGTHAVRVDVRVICATHRDLRAMVEHGTFREDLYYRLSGMVVEVPPLRARRSDLPLLASEILLRMARENELPHKRLEPDALVLLGAHPWPGNVRELENALRAAALFSDGDGITADDLARHVPSLRDALRRDPREGVGTDVAAAAGGDGALSFAPEDAVYHAVREGEGLRELQRRVEHECIVRALRETNGHVTRAAALLGIKRPRLSQLIKQHNLRVEGDE